MAYKPYVSVTVDGMNAKGVWGIVAAFRDENKLVMGGQMERAKLVELANHRMQGWLATSPDQFERMRVST